MAVAFPLSLANFIDQLPIKNVRMPVEHANEISRTRRGQAITAYLGPPLWQGEVVLGKSYNQKARHVRALISLASQYDASFFMTDPTYTGPAADSGAGLAGRNPVLSTAIDNGRDLQITGLAPGYVLMGGDMLSWTFGADPVRYAMHTVVYGATAGAGGAVTVEVQPMIREGSLVAGRPVNFMRPVFLAKIDPGSVNIGTNADFIAEGSTFGFIQVAGA